LSHVGWAKSFDCPPSSLKKVVGNYSVKGKKKPVRFEIGDEGESRNPIFEKNRISKLVYLLQAATGNAIPSTSLY
jgi:hypothetical protein